MSWIVIAREYPEGTGVDYIGPFETDDDAAAWTSANPKRECLPPRPLLDPREAVIEEEEG